MTTPLAAGPGGCLPIFNCAAAPVGEERRDGSPGPETGSSHAAEQGISA